MTKAAYCSKEMSLALQKKGIEAHHVMKFEKGGSWYWRYTLDIICRWFRETHGLHIHTFCLKKWHYEIQVLKGEDCSYSKGSWDNPDKAIEEAIWYCINNLI